MSKLGIIAGKIATGIAEVAVPVAMQNHAARIQEKRDKALHEFEMKRQKSAQAHDSAGQERVIEARSEEGDKTRKHQSQEADKTRKHQSQEADKGRTHESSERGKDRAARKEEADASRKHQSKENALSRGVQREQMELSRDQFDAEMKWNKDVYAMDVHKRMQESMLRNEQIKDVQFRNKITELAMQREEDSQMLLQVLNSSNASPSDKAAALESYYLLNPDARKKVVVKQIRDKYDRPTGDFAIFDMATGRRMDVNGQPPAGPGGASAGQFRYSSLQALRQAWANKQIDDKTAEAEMKRMMAAGYTMD